MPTPNRLPRLIASALVNLLIAFGLMGLMWGSFPGFFGDPPRAISAVLMMAPAIAAIAFTSFADKGVKHLDEGKGFVALVNAAWSLGLMLMIFSSGRRIGMLPGGDTLRYAGVLVAALGAVYRVGSMVQLGRRFSLNVALQAEHQLQITGFYARIRHPSYLGLMLMTVGIAMIFKSVYGVFLTLATLVLVVGRIRREDKFLAEQFGDEYRAYMTRTARMIPGVY